MSFRAEPGKDLVKNKPPSFPASSPAVSVDSSPEIMPPSRLTIDHKNLRYPFCIVWTPIPMLTWFFPFLGHMGICTSAGIIRDFAGSYYVAEGNMGFGIPTKYWQLDPSKAYGNQQGWDRAVHEASEEYKHRAHNLFCDNCHSHVCMALNLMHYDGSTSWNMVKVCFLFLLYSRYVNIWGFLKTWMPFVIVCCIVAMIWLLGFSHADSS